MTRLECFCSAAVAAATVCCCCAEDYSARFERGKWNEKDWMMVKSPRWPDKGKFIQQDKFIVNAIPKDASEQDMLGKRAAETYASMMLNKKFTGNSVIRSKMEFAHRMAPLITIAPSWGKSATDGFPEHREHFEVVLFDEGLNVWHHEYKDGKPSWHKAAYLKCKFEPNKVYDMEIRITHTRRGPEMQVSCGGHTFGYLELDMPREYYVGITGCEGLNRFHDFHVSNK